MTDHMRRCRGERGSAATEIVILVPMAVLIVGFIILVGRLSTTNQDVTSASRDAARAASVRQYPGAASADGTAAASSTLGWCRGGPSLVPGRRKPTFTFWFATSAMMAPRRHGPSFR